MADYLITEPADLEYYDEIAEFECNGKTYQILDKVTHLELISGGSIYATAFYGAEIVNMKIPKLIEEARTLLEARENHIILIGGYFYPKYITTYPNTPMYCNGQALKPDIVKII